MSAFDVTGAVISAMLIFLFSRPFFSDEFDLEEKAGSLVMLFFVTSWFVFCIARIFGAHL